MLDALFVEPADRDLRPTARRRIGDRESGFGRPLRLLDYKYAGANLMRGVIVTLARL